MHDEKQQQRRVLRVRSASHVLIFIRLNPCSTRRLYIIPVHRWVSSNELRNTDEWLTLVLLMFYRRHWLSLVTFTIGCPAATISRHRYRSSTKGKSNRQLFSMYIPISLDTPKVVRLAELVFVSSLRSQSVSVGRRTRTNRSTCIVADSIDSHLVSESSSSTWNALDVAILHSLLCVSFNMLISM
jgi:hypothetical protein